MKNRPLGAHVPWARIEDALELVISLGLSPEIAFKGPELDRLDQQQMAWAANLLARHHLRPTVHAPFFDLNPGALDPLIREVTGQRLQQALTVAGRLNAHLMVVHPGYDRWRYPGLANTWGNLAAAFFPLLLDQAETLDCRLALENIYEETPDTLIGLVDALASPWFGHCFDVGHWHLFGRTPLKDWLAAVGPRLLHLHLHDNQGRADDHLPVGDGRIDFPLLFSQVTALSSTPSMTLEAHSPEALKRSLQRVNTLLPSCPQKP